jgi:hypothetical protein
LAFRDIDGAIASLEAVQSDYPRHAGAAREIAAAHFADEVVLPPLLERATSTSRRTPAEEITSSALS